MTLSAAGGPQHFATTRWSLVVKAAEADGAQALTELCRAYWHPVRSFMRSHGLSAEDAADVTQGFFESLLARNDLAKVDRARGRFRTWLRSCARYYLFNWYARAGRVSTGGRSVHVSLDEHAATLPQGSTPERLYDQRWALTVLDRALDRLRHRYERANKAALFAYLRGSLRGEGSDLSDAQLAARLGKTACAVKVERNRFKQRLHECLREEVAQTVGDPGEVDDELRWLYDALV